MKIASIHLKNFRCFPSIRLDLDTDVILIAGSNGSGKTTLLEAIHYACYFKSFKTHNPKQMIQLGAEGFGVHLGIANSSDYDRLSVVFNQNKKTVKLNEKGVASYKELYDTYKVITITEDDLQIIKGGPAVRRTFIDQMVLLLNPEYALLAKKYRTILDNRNAVISKSFREDSYELWTDQLLKYAHEVMAARRKALSQLTQEAIILMKELYNSDELEIQYQSFRPLDGITSYQELVDAYPALPEQERTNKRSMIGPHLDDISIIYKGKSSRTHASRGQQKLLLVLLKLAQMRGLKTDTILLLDDFLTDFDDERISALLPLLTENASQVILTTPIEDLMKDRLNQYKLQVIDLEILQKE